MYGPPPICKWMSGEGVGEEPNVCTDVDGNPAAPYQFGKDRELRLTRACLLRTPVENRWWVEGKRALRAAAGKKSVQSCSLRATN